MGRLRFCGSSFLRKNVPELGHGSRKRVTVVVGAIANGNASSERALRFDEIAFSLEQSAETCLRDLSDLSVNDLLARTMSREFSDSHACRIGLLDAPSLLENAAEIEQTAQH